MPADPAQLSLPIEATAEAAGVAPAPVQTAAPAPSPEPSSDAPADDEIHFVRRRGTRRYILRVMDDGSLRVTVPWWGSKREARAFVASQQAWVARQRARRHATAAARWTPGSVVLVDGEPRPLETDADGVVRLEGARVAAAGDGPRVVRDGVHRVLRARARRELPGALLSLAATHGITVSRVTIRNQASRWGSCSRQGGIALNWRLVQTPPWVRDYVLLHELMHRRELNHSPRFWRHVAAVCPRYVEARRWLRVEGAHLFD